MLQQRAQNIYQQNAANTATPQELTLMLYNGCIKFIKLSKQGIEEKNIEKRHKNNIKAQNIIRELMVTLNMDIPISKNLLQLYDYILIRLTESNTKNNLEILEEVEEMVVDLRNTWKEAMKLAKTQRQVNIKK